LGIAISLERVVRRLQGLVKEPSYCFYAQKADLDVQMVMLELNDLFGTVVDSKDIQ
jgi:hypothetical protein